MDWNTFLDKLDFLLVHTFERCCIIFSSYSSNNVKHFPRFRSFGNVEFEKNWFSMSNNTINEKVTRTFLRKHDLSKQRKKPMNTFFQFCRLLKNNVLQRRVRSHCWVDKIYQICMYISRNSKCFSSLDHEWFFQNLKWSINILCRCLRSLPKLTRIYESPCKYIQYFGSI